jgi:hypothetical protein
MMPPFARPGREISTVAKTQRRHADVLGDNALGRPRSMRGAPDYVQMAEPTIVMLTPS